MSLKQKFLEAREYTLRNIHKILPFPEMPKLEMKVVREEIVPKPELRIPGGYAVEKEPGGWTEYKKEIRRHSYTSTTDWTETVTVREQVYRVRYKDWTKESWQKLREYGKSVDRWYNELDEKMRIGLIALAVERYLGLEHGSDDWAEKINDILNGTCGWEELDLASPETLWDIVVEIRDKSTKT